MLEFVLGVPFDTVVKAFRNWEQINELEEAVKTRVEVTNHGSPASCRRVIDLNFVSQGDVSVDRSDPRYHCG